jgi:hypothetical protein
MRLSLDVAFFGMPRTRDVAGGRRTPIAKTRCRLHPRIGFRPAAAADAPANHEHVADRRYRPLPQAQDCRTFYRGRHTTYGRCKRAPPRDSSDTAFDILLPILPEPPQHGLGRPSSVSQFQQTEGIRPMFALFILTINLYVDCIETAASSYLRTLMEGPLSR